MKASIHPQWYPDAQVSCVCGNVFSVGSTKSEIHVEICSRCHPFFTGKMNFTTGKGKVERFQERREKAKTFVTKKTAKQLAQTTSSQQPKSLKEMLMGLK